MNFFVQIDDRTSGPTISSIDLLTGTIFKDDNLSQFNLVTGPEGRVQGETTLTASQLGVLANGLAATLLIDTTDVFDGIFDLLISTTDEGSTTFFDNSLPIPNSVPATINNGTITVIPVPSALLLWIPLAVLVALRRSSGNRSPSRV